MDIPMTYEDVENAYARLNEALSEAFQSQQELNMLDVQKAGYWAELCSDPNFKPGKSNLEQDAKLRAAYPLFMASYDIACNNMEYSKFQVDLARTAVQQVKALLDLGRILVVEHETD